MRRWLPVLLLAVALCGNLAERAYRFQFLEFWTPGMPYPLPKWLAPLVYLSVPASLLATSLCWRPDKAPARAPVGSRKVAGHVALALTILFWLMFQYQGLFAAWLTATPAADVAYWARRSARMFDCAALSLGLGGALTLWLKGVRMPPRNHES